MRRIWRLAVLVVATTVAFGAAVVRFESAAEDGCAQRAASDPAYEVRVRRAAPVGRAPAMPDMPGMAETPTAAAATTYRVRVLHGGLPVRGARVCLSAYMRGMSAMAVVGHGRERSGGGIYEVDLAFPMDGEWSARVVVAEPRRAPVAVTFALAVD